MNTIAEQILALQTMPAGLLAVRFAELFGKQPRVRNVAWLRRQVAWKLQEREYGGLSDHARARLDELVAQTELPVLSDDKPSAPPRSVRAEPAMPVVGTTLVRRWRDQEIRVTVRENGVEWNGVMYGSLSAAAKAITGASWNGRLFFGLAQRRASR